MRIAGRFKPCVHMGCFDLETFVELNQRSRKVRICACRSTSKCRCALGLFEHVSLTPSRRYSGLRKKKVLLIILWAFSGHA